MLGVDNPHVSAFATFLFRTRPGQGRGARGEVRLGSFQFFRQQAGPRPGGAPRVSWTRTFVYAA
eukprot:14297022-Alexandrium_andersonii.AAC.1